MSTDHALNERLMSLAKLLEQLPAPVPAAASDDNAARLAGIPDARLRTLGERLRARAHDAEMDAEDAMLLRLLLDEYVAAVRRVRTVADNIGESLNQAETALREGRRAALITRGS